MLPKFKITTCVFILCLFGLTLITVSPVFAGDSAAFVECQKIKGKTNKEAKIKCFADLAQSILPLGDNTGRQEACDKTKGGKKRANCFRNLARTLQDEDDARGQAKDAQRLSDKAEAKLWDGKDGGTWYAADVEAGPKWQNEKREWCSMVKRRIPGSGNGKQVGRREHLNWFTLAAECEPIPRTTNMDGTQRTLEQELEAEMSGSMGY